MNACFHYSGLHDQIKFRKWGYGKATDHACREIRLKRMTREEGIEMVRKYQDNEPQDVDLFLEWLGMSRDELWEHVDRFRDSRIWNKTVAGDWELKDSILNHADDEGVDDVRLEKKEHCHFRVMPPKNPNMRDDKYVLIGRGWVDR